MSFIIIPTHKINGIFKVIPAHEPTTPVIQIHFPSSINCLSIPPCTSDSFPRNKSQEFCSSWSGISPKTRLLLYDCHGNIDRYFPSFFSFLSSFIPTVSLFKYLTDIRGSTWRTIRGTTHKKNK